MSGIFNYLEKSVDIYLPSEDTFLLEDALRKDSELINKINPKIILEIGSGTGYLSNVLENDVLKEKKILIATDISINACNKTKEFLRSKSKDFDVIRSDLFSCFKDEQFIDLVIFNPPYVPCELSERDKKGSNTYYGGIDGLEVIDEFLKQLLGRLTDKSVVYFITMTSSNLLGLSNFQIYLANFNHSIVLSQKNDNEYLSVHRLCYNFLN
ncbi:MAG: HemK methyltransferase member 2 [Marteilia pararefringens]